MRLQRGQASVELVALLPVLVVVVAAVVQVLAAGTARERASAAAEAGAVALLQDTDPQAAIEAALGGSVERSSFTIDRRKVRVTVRPRAFAPGLGAMLAATSTADAGAQAEPVALTVVRGGDGESARPRDDDHAARDGRTRFRP